jgi:hypothetical protein
VTSAGDFADVDEVTQAAHLNELSRPTFSSFSSSPFLFFPFFAHAVSNRPRRLDMTATKSLGHCELFDVCEMVSLFLVIDMGRTAMLAR